MKAISKSNLRWLIPFGPSSISLNSVTRSNSKTKSSSFSTRSWRSRETSRKGITVSFPSTRRSMRSRMDLEICSLLWLYFSPREETIYSVDSKPIMIWLIWCNSSAPPTPWRRTSRLSNTSSSSITTSTSSTTPSSNSNLISSLYYWKSTTCRGNSWRTRPRQQWSTFCWSASANSEEWISISSNRTELTSSRGIKLNSLPLDSEA
jgi:hypothetical protein